MDYSRPDRVPYFEEGIRDEVIRAWRRQGLPRRADLFQLFHYDRREEIEGNLDPRPARWPMSRSGLDSFRRRLDALDLRRLPADLEALAAEGKERGYPIILRVHHGFFLSLGVGEWRSFQPAIYLTKDDPALVTEIMSITGECAARLAESILSRVEVDAALFSEPISDNTGPLISPRMYAELVLPSYRPLLDVLKKWQVKLLILRTYANPRILLPALFQLGFNCLWACETPTGKVMDYRCLREEYGGSLRLVGGIDADALRQDKAAIRREMEKVPELLAQGGYIPLLDGRVREDVPFELYRYYRSILEEMTAAPE